MAKRPLIGITAGFNNEDTYQILNRHFMEAITLQGAMPVMLPVTDDKTLLEEYAQRLDGFLFSGGADVDPIRFGQWQKPACGTIEPLRDAHELALASILIRRGDRPVLGVCRGVQVLNIALGGDVYQDLPTEYEGQLIAHRQKQPSQYTAHPVDVVPGTLLHRILGTESIMVNSLHHQAIHRLGNWQACAAAPDGVIEAAELPGHPFFLGVQWHPERLFEHDRAESALFASFAAACANV